MLSAGHTSLLLRGFTAISPGLPLSPVATARFTAPVFDLTTTGQAKTAGLYTQNIAGLGTLTGGFPNKTPIPAIFAANPAGQASSPPANPAPPGAPASPPDSGGNGKAGRGMVLEFPVFNGWRINARSDFANWAVGERRWIAKNGEDKIELSRLTPPPSAQSDEYRFSLIRNESVIGEISIRITSGEHESVFTVKNLPITSETALPLYWLAGQAANINATVALEVTTGGLSNLLSHNHNFPLIGSSNIQMKRDNQPKITWDITNVTFGPKPERQTSRRQYHYEDDIFSRFTGTVFFKPARNQEPVHLEPFVKSGGQSWIEKLPNRDLYRFIQSRIRNQISHASSRRDEPYRQYLKTLDALAGSLWKKAAYKQQNTAASISMARKMAGIVSMETGNRQGMPEISNCLKASDDLRKSIEGDLKECSNVIEKARYLTKRFGPAFSNYFKFDGHNFVIETTNRAGSYGVNLDYVLDHLPVTPAASFISLLHEILSAKGQLPVLNAAPVARNRRSVAAQGSEGTAAEAIEEPEMESLEDALSNEVLRLRRLLGHLIQIRGNKDIARAMASRSTAIDIGYGIEILTPNSLEENFRSGTRQNRQMTLILTKMAAAFVSTLVACEEKYDLPPENEAADIDSIIKQARSIQPVMDAEGVHPAISIASRTYLSFVYKERVRPGKDRERLPGRIPIEEWSIFQNRIAKQNAFFSNLVAFFTAINGLDLPWLTNGIVLNIEFMLNAAAIGELLEKSLISAAEVRTLITEANNFALNHPKITARNLVNLMARIIYPLLYHDNSAFPFQFELFGMSQLEQPESADAVEALPSRPYRHSADAAVLRGRTTDLVEFKSLTIRESLFPRDSEQQRRWFWDRLMSDENDGLVGADGQLRAEFRSNPKRFNGDKIAHIGIHLENAIEGYSIFETEFAKALEALKQSGGIINGGKLFFFIGDNPAPIHIFTWPE